MPYRNLKQLNFTENYFISPNKQDNLSYVRSLPAVPGVYAIVANNNLVRLKGASDIIYIGQTKNLRNRIKTLFKYLIPENVYRITYNHTARPGLMKILNETDYNLSITFLAHNNPREVERKLLTAYCNNHIETPPLNNQRE